MHIRSKTISGSRRITRIERAGLVQYPEDADRPATRADCVDGHRPCPFVSCAHHLYLDVTELGGLRLNFPDLQPEEMTESCALDVADRGGETLESVGSLVRLTRERVRQIEEVALARIAEGLARDESRTLDPGPGASPWTK